MYIGLLPLLAAQALTHLRTRLALLGVLPTAGDIAAAVILRAFPQDVHRSGTQPASAIESPRQLEPSGSAPQQSDPPPDWKAALLAGGRRHSSAVLHSGDATAAGAAHSPPKPQSSLCERLLAELLLRAMPDRQCASWPVQHALQVRHSAIPAPLWPQKCMQAWRHRVTYNVCEAHDKSVMLLLQAYLAAGQPATVAAAPQQRVAACSPLALAAAALSLLTELAKASGPPASAAEAQAVSAEQAAGPADETPEQAGSSPNAAAWTVLCKVFASIAAEVSAPQQQRALLRLCLEVLIRCAFLHSTCWVAM